jgi:hypothetical protein
MPCFALRTVAALFPDDIVSGQPNCCHAGVLIILSFLGKMHSCYKPCCVKDARAIICLSPLQLLL